MKKHTIVSTLILLIVLALNVSANVQDDSYRTGTDVQLPNYTVSGISIPIPTKVVAPKVNRETHNQEAEMIFRIGVDGRVHQIQSSAFGSQQNHFRSLESAMRAVLPYWQFEPALDNNGNPVSVKVALPVRIIKSDKRGVSYSSIALAEPNILSVVMR